MSLGYEFELVDCCHWSQFGGDESWSSAAKLGGFAAELFSEKRCDPPLREGRSDGSQIYVGGYVGGYVISSNLSLLSAALHPAPNAGENTASGCLMISS